MDSHEPSIMFQDGVFIQVNRNKDSLFYVFDHGVRSSSVNMEFQHFHSFYEIFILLDDEAAHIIEGEYFNLQKYDMVFLRPSLLHMTIYPEGDAPKRRLIIAFRIPDTATGLDRQVKRVLGIFDGMPPVFRFSSDVLEILARLLNDIFKLGIRQEPGWELIVHGKFMEFLWTVYTNREANHYHKVQTMDSIVQKIYEVTGYIHAHYMEPVSLKELARKFYISSFYLSRQFKVVTGFSFITYLHLTRVRNAQQLLLYTNGKIKDIAEKCGFTSFSQFNRVFNTFCGMSPTEFRRDKNMRLNTFRQMLDRDRSADDAPFKGMIPPDSYIAGGTGGDALGDQEQSG